MPECLDSLLKQSYKNIEIILVNDGSEGNADEICSEYAAQYTRIKYFSKQNEGVAIARNFGLSRSSGEYIYCVDSDDSVKENLITEIVHTFENTNSDFIVVGPWFGKNISIMGALPTWGFAVKRELLEKYPDVRFQEHFQPCEDGLFSHKLMALAENISICPSDGYIYRRHANSSEHNINTDKIYKDIPKWMNILKEFYNKYDLWESKKLHLLSFIMIEPFGRLYSQPLKKWQKYFLFRLLKNFIRENKLIPCEGTELLNNMYQEFLGSKNHVTYMLSRFLLFHRAFSVQDDYSTGEKHKIISIFFIRIKFKVK